MRQPTQAEWGRISDLFDRLVDQTPERRETTLSTARLDPAIAARVRAMLASHDRVGVLDTIVSQHAKDSEEPGYSSLDAGAVVGPFNIVRLIGRGGMGEVYLAERTQGFTQRVALKLLRPEAAGRMAPFDAERRMLAALEHPGIARLIDGGLAPDGRPYMALEYVEGQPISSWCASRAASVEERLRLILEVCDAVHYAHARLVIHRDIKPANILVDGEGRARLLDFGVAKILGDTAADQTATQAMLTPDYAAPEQFARGQATVATDVYALGGVLFELLTGRGAWQRERSAMPSALARMMRDEPDPPSRVAAREGNAPVPPGRIAGDLDAIVMKAMRHDPADRYASVATMADDIRRHLRFEPVQARRGTAGYQLRRFVRRHRATTAAGAAAVLALVAGITAFAWQAHRVAAERDVARAQAQRAEAVNEAVSLMFRNAQDFGKGGSESAKDLLNDSAARLIQSFGEQSPDTAPVVIALAELYLEIDDVVGAQSLLATALDKGVGDDDPIAKARLQATLGTVEGATGQFDEATKLLDAAGKVFAADPERYRKDRLEAGAARAQILRQQGKRDDALAILLDELPDAEAEYAGDPRSLLIRYNNLGVHLVEAGRLDQLDAVLRRGEAVVARAHQERTPMAISLLQLRGGWYARKDNQAAALATFRKAADLRRALYGPSRALANDLLQVGRTELGLGQVGQAMPTLIAAHDMAVDYAGAASPITLLASMTLAEGYAHQGSVTEAWASLRSAEPGLKPLGTTGILYGIYLRSRSQIELAERKFDAAAADLDASEALFKALGAPADPYTKSIPGLRDVLIKARTAGTV